MFDREKVVKGLERCKLYNKVNCDKCPYDYNGRGNGKSECTAELASDALATLKEQPDIVRCKDCKYANRLTPHSNTYECASPNALNKMFFQFHASDWFCADGERR